MGLTPGSRVTVTLLSDVDTRSTDSPRSEKQRKASARNPTSCHMPSVSMDTSVMRLRPEMALTRGASLPARDVTRVPGSSGWFVHSTLSGIPCRRQGLMLRGCRTEPPVDAISCASS